MDAINSITNSTIGGIELSLDFTQSDSQSKERNQSSATFVASRQENTDATGLKLDPAKQEIIRKLQQRDAEVRTHEQAHMAAGGAYAGAASYSYQKGPNGQMYATGGEVGIDTSAVPGDPEATAAKARQVAAAALAPASPSAQDHKVAGQARQMEAEARQESQQVQREENAEKAEKADKSTSPAESENTAQSQSDPKTSSDAEKAAALSGAAASPLSALQSAENSTASVNNSTQNLGLNGLISRANRAYGAQQATNPYARSQNPLPADTPTAQASASFNPRTGEVDFARGDGPAGVLAPQQASPQQITPILPTLPQNNSDSSAPLQSSAAVNPTEASANLRLTAPRDANTLIAMQIPESSRNAQRGHNIYRQSTTILPPAPAGTGISLRA